MLTDSWQWVEFIIVVLICTMTEQCGISDREINYMHRRWMSASNAEKEKIYKASTKDWIAYNLFRMTWAWLKMIKSTFTYFIFVHQFSSKALLRKAYTISCIPIDFFGNWDYQNLPQSVIRNYERQFEADTDYMCVMDVPLTLRLQDLDWDTLLSEEGGFAKPSLRDLVYCKLQRGKQVLTGFTKNGIEQVYEADEIMKVYFAPEKTLDIRGTLTRETGFLYDELQRMVFKQLVERLGRES